MECCLFCPHVRCVILVLYFTFSILCGPCFSVCVLLRISYSLSRFLFTFTDAYVFFSATSSSIQKFSSLFLCLFANVIQVKTLAFSSLFPRPLLFSHLLFSCHFKTMFKGPFTWSGVSFFCFVSPRAWKQKKPTPLDRGPPTPCKQALSVKLPLPVRTARAFIINFFRFGFRIHDHGISLCSVLFPNVSARCAHLAALKRKTAAFILLFRISHPRFYGLGSLSCLGYFLRSRFIRRLPFVISFMGL